MLHPRGGEGGTPAVAVTSLSCGPRSLAGAPCPGRSCQGQLLVLPVEPGLSVLLII